MTLRIVGFNLSHDSSVCLVEDGQVRAALALERTTQVKRGLVPAHAYATAMADLTQQVLGGIGLTTADVDRWIATSTESRDQQDERRLVSSLGLLVPPDRTLSLPHPGHHLAHASAAFYASGFDAAAAIVVDAYGSLIGRRRERESAFMFTRGAPPRRVLQLLRDDDRIAGRHADGGLSLPVELSGIGEIYRVVTLALGFYERGTSYDDAGKTMGLAPYGKPLSNDSLFIQVGPQGLSFDGAAQALIDLGLAVRVGESLRLIPRPPGSPIQPFHRNLAAQVQREFEDACLHLVREVLARTRSRSLVAAGGCFLNSVLNTKILTECGVERLFVFPAATDDGNAIGAALYAHHVLLQQRPSPSARPVADVFLGPPRLPDCDVGSLAMRWGLRSHRHPGREALATAAATAIEKGEIVGWFQDRAEFGPRALGGRSILCHPGLKGMKDALNRRVKFREPFRPFAASVLAERAPQWFALPAPDSPYMLLVCPVLAERRELIGEVVHIDGTCRIQTVDDDLTGPFRALLEVFEQRTGLPLVLNTSFNLRGKPIVERPEDALDCLYGSRLGRLYIGQYEIEAPDLGGLCPVRTFTDLDIAVKVGDSVRLPNYPLESTVAVVGTNGSSQRITGARLGLLARATGEAPVRDLAAEVGMSEDEAVDAVLELRLRGLLRWQGVPGTPAPAFPLPQYVPQSFR